MYIKIICTVKHVQVCTYLMVTICTKLIACNQGNQEDKLYAYSIHEYCTSVIAMGYSLGRLLHSAIGFEVGHKLLHACKGVGELTVTEDHHCPLYPVKQV